MDYSALKTREECDKAKAEVEFERRTLANRDEDADIADERADRSQLSITSQLAKVNARITTAEAVLAAPGIDADTQETTTDELAALQVQRTRLLKRQRQGSGLARFLAAVDAEQVAVQVAALTTILAGIDAHRATLPG